MTDHEHDWRPDGESWLKTVTACDCEYPRNRHQLWHDDSCSKEKKRVRRYTCHCGASKTVDLKKSGDKQ